MPRRGRLAVAGPDRQGPRRHVSYDWVENLVGLRNLVPSGADRCRLLSRSRTGRPRQPGLRIATRLMEPVTLGMTRRMLRGIAERAERRFASGVLVAVPAGRS